MFHDKGQIRILEAFLAVGVIFSALLISFTFPASPDLTKQKSLTQVGMQTLMKLDTNGTLGNLITHEDWAAIKESLDILLPTGVSFNLDIYNENSEQVNSQPIRNSNLLSGETVSVQYVCATRNQVVQLFLLRLQLAWTR